MSGVKGRSGRKRNIANAAKYFNELYDARSYDLAEVTINKALQGDREMLIYCHDRRLGKPKVQVDTNITGGDSLGAKSLLQFVAALKDLREGNGQERISTGMGEEEEGCRQIPESVDR